MTTKIVNPMTEKQTAFLNRLFTEVYGTDNAAEAKLVWVEKFDHFPPSTVEASAQIDALLQMAKIAKPADTIPDGIHVADGLVYRVRHAKSTGNQYAERLLREEERPNNDDKPWLYVGRAPLHTLSADTLLTLDQARVHGKAYGACVKCGALLEDPVSVEAGIGPVCATKF
jgi:hypothetical protein